VVEGIRFIERMKANPVDKDALAEQTAPLRRVFMKSVVAGSDLRAGTVLSVEHLAVKKAGAGLSASRIADLVGCRLKGDKRADELIVETDVEGLN
jgi:N-acetylneuraminate synthase